MSRSSFVGIRGVGRQTFVLSIARVAASAAGLAVLPILARYLAPADFGVVALAMVAVHLSMVISDGGLGLSLVHVPASERGVWSSVFWLNTLWAAAVSAILAVGAYIFRDRSPEVADAILWLSVLPMIAGIQAAHLAELQQRQAFNFLAATEVVSALLGLVVACVLAVGAYGVWAIVGQHVTTRGTKLAMALWGSEFRPQIRFSRKGADQHILFARNTLGHSLLNYASNQMDNLVIGAVQGTAALGLYMMSFKVMMIPMTILGGPFQRVLYPRLVALNDNPEAFRSTILVFTRLVGGLLIPGAFVVAASAHELVSLVLTDAWLGAAPAIALMSIGGAIGATMAAVSGPALMARHLTALRFRITLEASILWLVAMVVAAQVSITAVAAAYLFVQVAYLPRLLAVFAGRFGIPFWSMARRIAEPAALGLVLAAIMLGVKQTTEWSSPVNVLAAAGVASLGLAAVLVQNRSILRGLVAAGPATGAKG